MTAGFIDLKFYPVRKLYNINTINSTYSFPYLNARSFVLSPCGNYLFNKAQKNSQNKLLVCDLLGNFSELPVEFDPTFDATNYSKLAYLYNNTIPSQYQYPGNRISTQYGIGIWPSPYLSGGCKIPVRLLKNQLGFNLSYIILAVNQSSVVGLTCLVKHDQNKLPLFSYPCSYWDNSLFSPISGKTPTYETYSISYGQTTSQFLSYDKNRMFVLCYPNETSNEKDLFSLCSFLLDSISVNDVNYSSNLFGYYNTRQYLFPNFSANEIYSTNIYNLANARIGGFYNSKYSALHIAGVNCAIANFKLYTETVNGLPLSVDTQNDIYNVYNDSNVFTSNAIYYSLNVMPQFFKPSNVLTYTFYNSNAPSVAYPKNSPRPFLAKVLGLNGTTIKFNPVIDSERFTDQFSSLNFEPDPINLFYDSNGNPTGLWVDKNTDDVWLCVGGFFARAQNTAANYAMGFHVSGFRK